MTTGIGTRCIVDAGIRHRADSVRGPAKRCAKPADCIVAHPAWRRRYGSVRVSHRFPGPGLGVYFRFDCFKPQRRDPTMSTRRIVLSRSAAIVGAAATGWLLPATAGAPNAQLRVGLMLSYTGPPPPPGGGAGGWLLAATAGAQSAKLRVGLMLPYTGTYAQLGVAVENGVRMAIDQQGGKLGGREIEWFKVDDESEPSKAVENASKLVQRDKAQVLIGTAHSGVQMGIQKVARETGVLSLIPNAGAHAATRAWCAPNVFRASFTNAQITLALGPAMVARGHKKAVWITWKYAAGEEAFEGFKQSYPAAGGSIIKELGLPFPNVEFQALLTEIAALQPDAVACFFAGGGAAKFIRDYAAAGLKDKIALYGSGFLTEGVLDAAGPAADGIITTMHYSDSLDTPRNKQFRME